MWIQKFRKKNTTSCQNIFFLKMSSTPPSPLPSHIKIRNDEYRGRCVIATKSFLPGETILSTSPQAYLPSENEERCATCFVKSTSLKKCKGCSYAHYCSRKCQIVDWKSNGHSKLCKYMVKLRKQLRNESELSDAILLIKTFTDTSRRDFVSSMCYHVPTSSSLERSSKRLIHTIQSTVPWISKCSKEKLLQTLYRFGSNNFAITDDLLLKTGAGVYPEGALLNHDCVPNCVVTYDGLVQNIRCIRKIKEGEELTHSYVDPYHSNTTPHSNTTLHTPTQIRRCVCNDKG